MWAGGVPASAPGARRRGADRIAACVPVDGGLAALARPPPLGARPTWASGCRSRWWRAPRTTPLARPRSRTRCRSPSSCCSRACRPSSAPRSCSARCSTSPTIGSLRSSARASRTPASSRAAPAATWRSGGGLWAIRYVHVRRPMDPSFDHHVAADILDRSGVLASDVERAHRATMIRTKRVTTKPPTTSPSAAGQTDGRYCVYGA